MPKGLADRLFEPVDIASLVLFRIAYGAIMLWELSRYWRGGVIEYFARHSFLFPYYGFEWVEPWPGDGVYVHFVVLSVLAAFIALGFLYRMSAALFCVGMGYVFLLDQSLFLNHIYLLVLVGGILACVPAHRAFSVDALLRPGLRSGQVPAWSLWLIRFQVGVPYFFGGLSKVNHDWLRGEPMRRWIHGKMDFLPLDGIFGNDWAAWFFSYGGMLFDLLIVPALLWRRTRLPAFLIALGFHFFNAHFFRIGVFPWFMIVATAMFFPPDFPRRAGILLGVGSRASEAAPEAIPPRRRRLVIAGLAVFVAVQLLLPLRHHLYPGSVFWSGEGLYFGWHMRGAVTQSSLKLFTVDATTGARRQLEYGRELSKRQRNAMSARPWMVHSYSRAWADRVERVTGKRLPVYAELQASLNGRQPQPKIDPAVNLAEEPTTLGPAGWILPLTEPLPTP